MNITLSNLENVLKHKNISQSSKFSKIVEMIVALDNAKDCGIMDRSRFDKLYHEAKRVLDADYEKLIRYVSSKKFGKIGKYFDEYDVKQVHSEQCESLHNLLGQTLAGFGEEVLLVSHELPWTIKTLPTFVAEFESTMNGLNEIKAYNLDKYIADMQQQMWQGLMQKVTQCTISWQKELVDLNEKNCKTCMIVSAHEKTEILRQIWEKTKNSYLESGDMKNVSRKIDKDLKKYLHNFENNIVVFIFTTKQDGKCSKEISTI